MKLSKLKITIISSFIFSSICFAVESAGNKREDPFAINVKISDQFKVSSDFSQFAINATDLDQLDSSEELLKDVKEIKDVDVKKMENRPLVMNMSNVSTIEENNVKYYLIETKVIKGNKSRDIQRAYVKAKAKLLHALKGDKRSVSAKLHAFILFEVKENQNERIFSFKIKQSDVQMLN